MCSSCGIISGNRSVLIGQGFVNVVPVNSFISDATYSDFMFYRCINEKKFIDALDTVKDGDTTIGKSVKTEDDVRKLANHADNGTDMTIWGVSFKKILGSIKFTPDELSNVKCKIAFSTNE